MSVHPLVEKSGGGGAQESFSPMTSASILSPAVLCEVRVLCQQAAIIEHFPSLTSLIRDHSTVSSREGYSLTTLSF